MDRLGRLLLTCLGLWLAVPAGHATAGPSLIDWQPLTEATFEQARREHRFVLLNLEAVWCHWCHVMDAETYADPAVAGLIERRYVPVRVDHDARPDLAQRYRDYGWPATIVFNADGVEIVKRAGYIPPRSFERLLQAIVDDPSPEAATREGQIGDLAVSPILSSELRAELHRRHEQSFDSDRGGLRTGQKFLEGDHVELALYKAARGDAVEATIARRSLDAARSLIDPAWGGAYQYSTFGGWDRPHYEKIVKTQATYLRSYALAYALWQRVDDRAAIEDIVRYLDDFLTSSEGAFYTSQDADLIPGQKAHDYFALDDQARRARGIPRIDLHVYARENGMLIEALTMAYEATGHEALLERTKRAARWILQHRILPQGGFSHGDDDAAGPYLGDTLAMGRALLVLHRASGEREWLRYAVAAAQFIDERFRQAGGGFLSAEPGSAPIAPVPQLDENIAMTRFANLLARYSGAERHRELAEHGMRYLATPTVALRRIEESGILLADLELASEPAHFTVVAPREAAIAAALYSQALRQPDWYRRIEWWDRTEGPLPNADVRYPDLDRPAGFLCADGRCSLPAFEPETYAAMISRLRGQAAR